jgi:hypothetical protein
MISNVYIRLTLAEKRKREKQVIDENKEKKKMSN